VDGINRNYWIFSPEYAERMIYLFHNIEKTFDPDVEAIFDRKVIDKDLVIFIENSLKLID